MAESKAGQLGQRLVNALSSNEQRDIDFDLDNWITDFEQCFPRFQKINPNFASNYWGVPFDERPRIKELNEQADAQQTEGYRVIEFFPNRNNKEESYIMFGTPIELMGQISNLMNMWLLMKNNGGDELIGFTADEYLKAKPREGLTILVMLTTYNSPPYKQLGTKWFSRHQIVIPFAEKSKITYDAIRKACGGNQGLNFGNWTARAFLGFSDSRKAVTQMVASGNSEETAKKNLDRFLQFTECKLLDLTATEKDFSRGNRSKNPNKERYLNFDVYPAWITVLNQKLVDASLQTVKGRQTSSGKQLRKSKRLYIYPQKSPSGWQSDFNDLASNYFPVK